MLCLADGVFRVLRYARDDRGKRLAPMSSLGGYGLQKSKNNITKYSNENCPFNFIS